MLTIGLGAAPAASPGSRRSLLDALRHRAAGVRARRSPCLTRSTRGSGWSSSSCAAATSATSACSTRWSACRASCSSRESCARRAYDDAALPIGAGQTISQPYMVARICELLALRGDERVLDVGTGSGYQAAVLAELAGEVHTIERLPELAERAREIARRRRLRAACDVHVGDGTLGAPEQAPFDAIAVAAAAPEPAGDALRPARAGRAARRAGRQPARPAAPGGRPQPGGAGGRPLGTLPLRAARRRGGLRRLRPAGEAGSGYERGLCRRSCFGCRSASAGSSWADPSTSSLDLERRRVIGLEVLCGDEARRFLPLAGRRPRDEIAVALVADLLEEPSSPSTGARHARSRARGARSSAEAGRQLVDLMLAPDGTIARSSWRRRRHEADNGADVSSRGGHSRPRLVSAGSPLAERPPSASPPRCPQPRRPRAAAPAQLGAAREVLRRRRERLRRQPRGLHGAARRRRHPLPRAAAGSFLVAVTNNYLLEPALDVPRPARTRRVPGRCASSSSRRSRCVANLVVL